MPIVVYGDGQGSPRSSPEVVLAAAGVAGEPEVLLCWFVEEPSWLSSPTLRGRTAMVGYGASKAVAAGRLAPVSVRLSGMPSLVAHLRPEVFVVTGVRRSSGFGFGTTVGWSYSAAQLAQRVVVEIDEDGFDFGGPDIPGNIVSTVGRPAGPVTESLARPADAIDLRIGAFVASLVPQGATLQFGPGGVGEGICLALDRPVSIWSGLVTDAMAGLADRGLLHGAVTAGYVWGGEPVRDLARAGRLDLQPIEITHDITRISRVPRFVACNTALQVDLAGSVNIEQLRGRQITSIGGHSDFCAGASRSPGGLSVIALRSTTPKGESSIVPVVERVSTQRSDVSAVVTEHGVADLRGASDVARAWLIAQVAAPEHRAALLAAAG